MRSRFLKHSVWFEELQRVNPWGWVCHGAALRRSQSWSILLIQFCWGNILLSWKFHFLHIQDGALLWTVCNSPFSSLCFHLVWVEGLTVVQLPGGGELAMAVKGHLFLMGGKGGDTGSFRAVSPARALCGGVSTCPGPAWVTEWTVGPSFTFSGISGCDTEVTRRRCVVPD